MTQVVDLNVLARSPSLEFELAYGVDKGQDFVLRSPPPMTSM
jgi:hypothetical protein